MADFLDGLGAFVAVVIGFLVLGAIYGLVQLVPFVIGAALQGHGLAQVALLGAAAGVAWLMRVRSSQ